MPVFIRLVLVFLAALVHTSVGFAGETGECESVGTQLEQAQCISKRLSALDVELNRIYNLALAAMPERDAKDTRKEKEQLRKSQRAWLKFKNDNCALIGGLEGGNNLSVTHFGALCEEKEVKARIKFLRSIADGSEKL